jgi:hypothetical protein
VRAPKGTIATFDPVGSATTIATSINRSGTVAGIYEGSNAYHGFLRAADGSYTTFDIGTDSLDDVTGINKKNSTTGYFEYPIRRGRTRTDGFLRRSNGTIVELRVPHAYSTVPESINDLGWITGYYQDRARVYHGFMRTP